LEDTVWHFKVCQLTFIKLTKDMSGFRLHAVGHFFDVDEFLSNYRIDHDSVWHRGRNNYDHSGFVKYLGNEYMLNTCEQEAIAIKYVQHNREALKALVDWQGVEAVILGISPEIQISQNVASICLSFSPRLVSLAVEVGLQLAFYVRPSISFDQEVPGADWY
jgi:hypothetical protein